MRAHLPNWVAGRGSADKELNGIEVIVTSLSQSVIMGNGYEHTIYDIAIVGAGPAGSTLARLLGDRYRVLLIDRRALAGSGGAAARRRKCCGGLVAPAAQRELARLGVGLPGSVLAGPQLFAVRTIDVASRQERFYQRNYINVDREAMDRWLCALVPAAVGRSFATSVRALAWRGDHFALDLGGRRPARARFLVGADGAASFVRRRCFGAASIRSYVAIQEWRECAHSAPYYGAIFDPAVTDFYGWTIPKGEHLLIGAALAPGRQAGVRFAIFKRRLRELGLGSGRLVRREGTRLLRPRHPGELCLGRGRIALIGEAAGWVSPSSAEGYSYAFASARHLAGALAPGISGAIDRYRRATRGLAANILGKSIKSQLMYSAWTRRLVMASGLSSVRLAELPGAARAELATRSRTA